MTFHRLRVRPGERHALGRLRPDFTGPFRGKSDAEAHLKERLERLASLQEKLYAQGRHAVLVILQGMDTAGKDSAIKHVFSGLNPQGVGVRNFRQPSSEELAHDFLWRAVSHLPQRGQMTVFNRSYYEEVAVVRVHPELLDRQMLPPARVSRDIWDERYEDIRAFERHLWRSGTTVIKLFLNISRAEQEQRLLDRLDDSTKTWKFSAGDIQERALWRAYVSAYEKALPATTSRHAPWYVVPADHKWFAHAAIAEILYRALQTLGLKYPPVGAAERRELARARRQLAARRRPRT